MNFSLEFRFEIRPQAEQVQGFAAAEGADDLKIFLGEQGVNELADDGVIIHHEDGFHFRLEDVHGGELNIPGMRAACKQQAGIENGDLLLSENSSPSKVPVAQAAFLEHLKDAARPR